MLSGKAALLALATFETALGFCLTFRYRLRLAVYLAAGHMLSTFLPLLFFPDETFTGFPVSLSLVGQYIFKNFVLLSALLVVYARSVKQTVKPAKPGPLRQEAGARFRCKETAAQKNVVKPQQEFQYAAH
ncbi:hypothetical protein ACXYMU_13635 [Pontibacter sp. CAU 1760]